MRLSVLAVAVALGFAQMACGEEIKIEGGGTAIAMVFAPIKARFEKHHGDYLSIVQSSAVKGLIALNDGKVDIAAAAHPLEDLLSGAEREGVAIDKSGLVATRVEENRLVIIANRYSEVARLSKDQLKGVFTGEVSNWKEVGGADLPVEVVWGRESEGQNIQFARVALDGEPVAPGIHWAGDYRSVVDMVGQLPGAVGVAPLELTTPATRSIDTVCITGPIYVITKGKPNEKVREIIDFYKAEYGFLK